MLEDDTFIVNKKRTIELADELIRRGNKLPFDSNCRADVGEDVEFFRTLKRAGARLFCVGFESGDPTVIDKMQKNLMKRKNNTYHADSEQFVRNCKEAGIMVHGCFMVGNLNETKASMAATLDLQSAFGQTPHSSFLSWFTRERRPIGKPRKRDISLRKTIPSGLPRRVFTIAW